MYIYIYMQTYAYICSIISAVSLALCGWWYATISQRPGLGQVLFTFNFCDRLCGGGSFNEEPHSEAFLGPVFLGVCWRILMDGKGKIFLNGRTIEIIEISGIGKFLCRLSQE